MLENRLQAKKFVTIYIIVIFTKNGNLENLSNSLSNIFFRIYIFNWATYGRDGIALWLDLLECRVTLVFDFRSRAPPVWTIWSFFLDQLDWMYVIRLNWKSLQCEVCRNWLVNDSWGIFCAIICTTILILPAFLIDLLW